jgi:hypothetical protein
MLLLVKLPLMGEQEGVRIMMHTMFLDQLRCPHGHGSPQVKFWVHPAGVPQRADMVSCSAMASCAVHASTSL